MLASASRFFKIASPPEVPLANTSASTSLVFFYQFGSNIFFFHSNSQKMSKISPTTEFVTTWFSGPLLYSIYIGENKRKKPADFICANVFTDISGMFGPLPTKRLKLQWGFGQGRQIRGDTVQPLPHRRPLWGKYTYFKSGVEADFECRRRRCRKFWQNF